MSRIFRSSNNNTKLLQKLLTYTKLHVYHLAKIR